VSLADKNRERERLRAEAEKALPPSPTPAPPSGTSLAWIVAVVAVVGSFVVGSVLLVDGIRREPTSIADTNFAESIRTLSLESKVGVACLLASVALGAVLAIVRSIVTTSSDATGAARGSSSRPRRP
jgi:hypothetical protein